MLYAIPVGREAGGSLLTKLRLVFTTPPPPVADGVSDCSGLGTALLWLKGSAVSLLNLHPVGVKLLNITLMHDCFEKYKHILFSINMQSKNAF